MFFTVYKITNKLNGKYYIGAHATSNLNDGYMGSGIAIQQAIEKYGIQNFIKEYLFFAFDAESMFAVEEILVIPVWEDEMSYNLDKGGNGASSERLKGNTFWLGRKHRKSSIRKMRKSATGRKHTEDTKQKMSRNISAALSKAEIREKMKANSKGNQRFLGHRHTPESRARMGEAARKYHKARREALSNV